MYPVHWQALSGLGRGHTRSISAENPTGAKGGGARATDGVSAAAAAGLPVRWKVSPCIMVEPGEPTTIAEIDGPGVITHMWFTTMPDALRSFVFRVYWDGVDEPAIEVPLGDFFCAGWNEHTQVSSAMIAVNPHAGLNSYWPMPFRGHARITVENTGPEPQVLFYQITYDVDVDVAADTGYLHAQFRLSKPVTKGVEHVILDGISGRGKYVGTYMTWGVNRPGWWGEGEVKFYLDGDTEHPTICGTGTEDYFGGAWDYDVPGRGYTEYTTPYLGVNQILAPDGLYRSQQRFGMYRWHLLDAIRFSQDIRADVQALGWKSRGRYALLSDDISTVALYYLDAASSPRPPLPDPDDLETEAVPFRERS